MTGAGGIGNHKSLHLFQETQVSVCPSSLYFQKARLVEFGRCGSAPAPTAAWHLPELKTPTGEAAVPSKFASTRSNSLSGQGPSLPAHRARELPSRSRPQLRLCSSLGDWEETVPMNGAGGSGFTLRVTPIFRFPQNEVLKVCKQNTPNAKGV